jgi:bla regulator protein BlaR1
MRSSKTRLLSALTVRVSRALKNEPAAKDSTAIPQALKRHSVMAIDRIKLEKGGQCSLHPDGSLRWQMRYSLRMAWERVHTITKIGREWRLYRLTLRVLLLIGLMALCQNGTLAIGQILHTDGERPTFEVATIKPWKRTPMPAPAGDGASAPVKVMKVAPVDAGPPPTNRVHVILPISILITSAYNLPVGSESRILGGPEWLRQDIDQFDIQAKIEDSEYAAMQKMTLAQRRERVALMEQSLLADRFKLKVHFEMREMPVYALVVAKGGAKLNPAKTEQSSRISTLGNPQGSEMTAIGVTLEQFVQSPLLTGAAGGRPVVVQTGLKAAFDFTLKWTPDSLSAPGAKEAGDAPSLFTAIREQLGLQLVASRAPVEVIVIDHIEQPSAN